MLEELRKNKEETINLFGGITVSEESLEFLKKEFKKLEIDKL